MLFDMLKEVEEKAGAAQAEPAKLTAPDRAVVELFVARLRRQIAAEAADAGAGQSVVPAKAGTQGLPLARTGEQATRPSGFPLPRE
jgi:hypothetical protein